MDSAAIIAEARRATGLHDFDSESFREGLDIVTRNLATNRDLSDVGRQTIAGIAIACLMNRLKVADYARRNPEVRNKPVPRPVFILGGPRTGTTLTSNLMAVDLKRRPLMRWEGLDSVPPPTQATLKTDPRCLAMKEAEAAHGSALSSASKIHHEEADGPTEDVIIHGQDFKSMMWDTMSDDPVYAKWILACDVTSIYDYHRLQLQVAQHHTINAWVLKAPSNAMFIHGLHKEYPDARIVWTHRDPYKALGSVCSLISEFRGRLGKVDEATLGPTQIAQFKLHLERPDALNDKLGPGKIYHLHYADLARDHIGEMRKLYAWLGDDFAPDVEAGMRQWLAGNPQGRFGKHTYNLARFGLNIDMLRPHFDSYIKKYNVALEGDV
jgi:hypothetical protein